MSYVQKQLDRIESNGDYVRVQFIDCDGNKTNWLNLTPEQFEKVKALLIELKQDE